MSESSKQRDILVAALDGIVVGVDRDSGAIVWRNDLRGAGYAEVALAIRSGRVFLSAGGSTLYCLDYAGGEMLWTAETSGSGRATILVDPPHVIVGKGGRLDCFDDDGNQLWSQALEGLGQGRVALGFPGNVVQADGGEP